MFNNLRMGQVKAIAPNGNELRVKVIKNSDFKLITNTVYNPKTKKIERVIEQFPATGQTFWYNSKGELTDEFRHSSNNLEAIHRDCVNGISTKKRICLGEDNKIYAVVDIVSKLGQIVKQTRRDFSDKYFVKDWLKQHTGLGATYRHYDNPMLK